MRKLAILTGLIVALSACADGSVSQSPAGGAATAPATSPEQLQATMCAHLIEELSPLLDAPIEVDASISKQWLDIAVALEQDAAAYQAVPDAVFATELLGVADAAYDIAVVTDPGGQPTSQALDEASITLTRQVRQLGGALPEETCTDHDRGAQSMLRHALVAAKVAYTDAGTYDSVTVEDLSMIEPSFPFAGDVPATVDAVSVNLLSARRLCSAWPASRDGHSVSGTAPTAPSTARWMRWARPSWRTAAIPSPGPTEPYARRARTLVSPRTPGP
jgi:hypothetical protein